MTLGLCCLYWWLLWPKAIAQWVIWLVESFWTAIQNSKFFSKDFASYQQLLSLLWSESHLHTSLAGPSFAAGVSLFLFFCGFLATYRFSFRAVPLTRHAIWRTPKARLTPCDPYGRSRAALILSVHPEMSLFRSAFFFFCLLSFVHRLRRRCRAPGHLAPAIGSY